MLDKDTKQLDGPDTPVVETEGEAAPAAVDAEVAVAAKPDSDEADATAKPAEEGEQKNERRGKPRTRLEDLEVGSEAQGKVMATAKFGVFVDIGAVTDGLVHVSEFPKSRFRRVEDVVEQGDTVDVWIKDVDVKGNRISLSMRKKPTRPMVDLDKGAVLTGTVTSVTKYGAFVEIGAETEGLVHISEMSSGYVERPAEVVKVGQSVEVRVKEIDQDRERISLSMIGLANDMGFGAEAESEQDSEEADSSQERMPTVVELALRKALGEMQPEEEEAAAEEEAEEEPVAEEEDEEPDDSDAEVERESLGEVYERMLEEYRQTREET